jgi:peptide deformylase
VDVVNDEVRALIDDLIETMYAAPGVGLAAPQVGVPLRLFVVDVSANQKGESLRVLVNPTIVSRQGMQIDEEGCLSLPGFAAYVLRPAHVVLAGLDRMGKPARVEGRGLMARALQHEMDHLDGTLFVDRLRPLKRRHILHRIQKKRRASQW